MKRYLGVWSLIAIALVVFVGYEAYCRSAGETDPWLRTAGFIETLWTDAPADADSVQLVEIQTVEPEPLRLEPDTLPKTILFVGDSMLEGLYPRLAAYCDASGHTLYAVIWYSSTSQIWAEADLLPYYIREYRPDYVFICIGSNELFVNDIVTKRDKHVAKIVSQIDTLPYLWIGPPNWKKDTGINSLIRRNARRGAYFCSDGMTFKRKKDGAHPTPESAVAWMDSIVRWMPDSAAFPLRLLPPEKKTGRAKRVNVHQPGSDPWPKKHND